MQDFEGRVAVITGGASGLGEGVARALGTLAERVLERVEREEGALQPSRADLDAEQVEQVLGSERLDLGDRLPLDLVGEERGARLADRAAAAGEGDLGDDPVADPEHQRDPVAAERVRPLVLVRGRLEDPEVVGASVVLEDVVAVEIVHRSSGYAALRPVGAQPKIRRTSFSPSTSASTSART